jgi:hypothetical protein
MVFFLENDLAQPTRWVGMSVLDSISRNPEPGSVPRSQQPEIYCEFRVPRNSELGRAPPFRSSVLKNPGPEIRAGFLSLGTREPRPSRNPYGIHVLRNFETRRELLLNILLFHELSCNFRNR